MADISPEQRALLRIKVHLVTNAPMRRPRMYPPLEPDDGAIICVVLCVVITITSVIMSVTMSVASTGYA